MTRDSISNRRNREARNSGSRLLRSFTLIEVVISIVVGVIICGTAGSLLWNASKQRTEMTARSELFDMASCAMELMVRFIREIPQDECPGGSSPCLNGNAQVTTATATDLRFDVYGFRRNSGATGIEMTRDTAATWNTLALELSSITFSYFDRSNVALTSFPLSATDRAKIRRVTVQIDFARAGQTARLRTSIYLRNFMDEVTTDP